MNDHWKFSNNTETDSISISDTYKTVEIENSEFEDSQGLDNNDVVFAEEVNGVTILCSENNDTNAQLGEIDPTQEHEGPSANASSATEQYYYYNTSDSEQNTADDIDIENAEFVFLDVIPASESQALAINNIFLEEQVPEESLPSCSRNNHTNSQVREINRINTSPEIEGSSDNGSNYEDTANNKKRNRKINSNCRSWKKNKNKILRMKGKQYVVPQT